MLTINRISDIGVVRPFKACKLSDVGVFGALNRVFCDRLSDIGVFERLIGARFQQNIRLSCASGYFAVMGSLLGIKSKRTNLLGPLAGRFMRLRDTL